MEYCKIKNSVGNRFGKAFAIISLSCFAACATPGKLSITGTDVTVLSSSVEIGSNQVSEEADGLAVLRIRYPAVVAEEARLNFNTRVVSNRLGYTADQLLLQYKYEQSNGINSQTTVRGSNVNDVAMMAVARSGVIAAQIYKEASKVYPGKVLLEPMEVSVDTIGGLISKPLDGAQYPPSELILDFAVYSHPRAESFAGRLIPLVTLRSGMDMEQGFYLASDGLASVAPRNEEALGYTLVDYLAAHDACLMEEGCLPFEAHVLQKDKAMELDILHAESASYVYPLEKIDLKKRRLRAQLEGKEGAADQMGDLFIRPLLSRVEEIRQLTSESIDYDAAMSSYGNLLFTQPVAEEVSNIIGPEDFHILMNDLYREEVAFIDGDSGYVHTALTESDYADSVRDVMIEEIRFKQREEIRNGISFATALAGAGASFAANSASAAQSILNSTTSIVLAFDRADGAARDNITLNFRPLLDKQRQTRSKTISNADEILETTELPEFRKRQSQDILDAVFGVEEDPVGEVEG